MAEMLKGLIVEAVRMEAMGGHSQQKQMKPDMPASAATAVTGTKTPMVHDMRGHAMTPYLFGDKRDFFVLFEQARVSSAGGLAGAIVASFAFAVVATIFANLSKNIEKKSSTTKSRISPQLFLSTVTFALRTLLHYIAMLIVMTMNIWLIIAVVVGHGVGHFVYELLFKNGSSEAACDC